MKNILHPTILKRVSGNSIVHFTIILILILLTSFTTATAQVTVTESQFQAIFTPGQIIDYSSSSVISPVNVGSTGGSNVYDFSNIGLPSVIEMNCYEVSIIPKLLLRFPYNGATLGTSPDLISSNIYFFGQDTVTVPGSVNMGAQTQFRHKSPPEIIAIFPVTYGYSYNQLFANIDTFVNTQGVVLSTVSHNKNKTSNIDGYGSLKVGSFNFQCLRMKTLDTDGNKQFIFLTREGIAVNIDVKGSQPDTGLVQINGIAVYYKGSLLGVKNENLLQPSDYSLSQNYPNPFNPSTTINYTVPKTGFLTIKIYNSLGELVSTLVNGYKVAGNFSTAFNLSNSPSGIYFCKMEAGDFSSVKKLILLK